MLAQDGFIMHCKNVICTRYFRNCKEEGDASGRDRGQKRGVEGVLAQLEEIFSKSMDESSNAT